MKVYTDDQPSYAGGPTFCRVPLLRDLSEATMGQVVVLGAPVDEAVSTRPGTRYGPRAIRLVDDTAGDPTHRRHLDAALHPFALVNVVDGSDVAVVPGDPLGNLRRIETAVSAVVAAGAIPLVLGGDHSVANATIRGFVSRASADGLLVVQVDAHADTAAPDIEAGRPPWSHGSPFRALVDDGVIQGSQLIQVGLRGYWPGEDEIAWAEQHGVRWTTMRMIRRQGFDHLLDALTTQLGESARVWLSFDIDSLDPAFAPGTGTPEPGGLTSSEALALVELVTTQAELAGMDLVEVSPPYDTADITALIAHRLAAEAITGVARRRTKGQER